MKTLTTDQLPSQLTADQTNRYVVQIFTRGRGWLDYASVKDTDDLNEARRLLTATEKQTTHEEFRVVDTWPNG